MREPASDLTVGVVGLAAMGGRTARRLGNADDSPVLRYILHDNADTWP